MSIAAVEPGKVYTLQTVKGCLVQIVFCHKNDLGEFQDGVTSEDLINILLDRHKGFVDKTDSGENHQIYTFLKQAQIAMNQRRIKKYQRKHNKGKQ